MMNQVSDREQRGADGAVIAALDIGSSKTGCLIARLGNMELSAEGLHDVGVLGVGYQRTNGYKSGVIFDPSAFEQSVRLAVDKAERQAGLTIDQIHVSFNAGRLRSENYGAAIELGDACIKQKHVDSLMQRGWDCVSESPDAILHSLPLGYALDGVVGIGEPMGYTGQNLVADFHVVTADLDPVRQILSHIEDCFLSPVSVVAAPYGSALVTMRPGEAHEGVAVLDIGAGSSSIAVFSNHNFVFADAIAKGGIQITSALARRFGMPWREAELLKLLIGRQADQSSSYPQGSELISRQLTSIFLHQKRRMIDTGFAFDLVKYIVLTGGTSLYHDAPYIAAEVFGKPVRCGAPRAVPGLPSQLVGAPFSSLWGILSYQKHRQRELAHRFAGVIGKEGKGPVAKIGTWLHHLGHG